MPLGTARSWGNNSEYNGLSPYMLLNLFVHCISFFWLLSQMNTTRGLQATRKYYLTVLKIRSPKIRASAGLPPSGGFRRESFSCLPPQVEAAYIPWLVALPSSSKLPL